MGIKSVTLDLVLLEIIFLKIISNVFVEDVWILLIQLITFFSKGKVIDDDLESAGLHVGINAQCIYIILH